MKYPVKVVRCNIKGLSLLSRWLLVVPLLDTGKLASDLNVKYKEINHSLRKLLYILSLMYSIGIRRML